MRKSQGQGQEFSFSRHDQIELRRQYRRRQRDARDRSRRQDQIECRDGDHGQALLGLILVLFVISIVVLWAGDWLGIGPAWVSEFGQFLSKLMGL